MNSEAILAALQLPSPVEEVKTEWSMQAGIQLFVKRDDLIHPLISGNKWRKLSGILQGQDGIEILYTFGGAYSNHLVATAVTAHLLGLRSKGVVRGEHFSKQSTVLDLCLFYGMELEFVSRNKYREMKLRSERRGSCLYIPEGGACPEGSVGCEEIINEGFEVDEIYIACGTGTSLAGLAKRCREVQAQTKVFGVPVLKQGEFIREAVKQINNETHFNLILDAHGGGYAKTSTALMDFIKDFASDTGILLDPIYTAKAAQAIKMRCLDGQLPEGTKAGLVHTGGLTGWYGKWTEAQ